MAVVNITINGRGYDIACDNSQVDRIEMLGRYLNDRSNTVASQVGAVPEAKMLVMIGLMLCDEIHDLQDNSQQGQVDQTALIAADEAIATSLEALSERLENIAERLERP